MMDMGHRLFLAIALLLLCASAVAQDAGGNGSGDDYARLYEEAVAKGDSLEIVKNSIESRRKALEDEVQIASENAERQESMLSTYLTKQLPEAEHRLEESGRAALLEQKSRLQSSIARLVADTADLEREIASVNGEMAAIAGFKTELDEMQAGDFDSMVADRAPYLERAFPEMSQDVLREIVDACGNFDGYAKARPFVAKAKAVSRAKMAYDEAMQALGQRFDRAKVSRARTRLQGLGRQGLNKAQRDAVTGAMRGLDSFERGLAEFKTFINKLNEKRLGLSNYNATLLGLDLPSILGREDGDVDAWAKDNGIQDVPYLDKAFDEYVNIIKSDPNAHPGLETEILNQ